VLATGGKELEGSTRPAAFVIRGERGTWFGIGFAISRKVIKVYREFEFGPLRHTVSIFRDSPLWYVGCSLAVPSSIAREALKRESRVHGLRAILESIMVDLMYEIPSQPI
jgi:hypothetical protein